MAQAGLILAREAGVLTMTIDRPDDLNRLSPELIDRLGPQIIERPEFG